MTPIRSLHIEAIDALEILDSRGQPTLSVRVHLSDDTVASAAVPAGLSTGAHEAVERRDGDAARYGGRGVRQAVAGVVNEIAPLLRGADPREQATIDRRLVELDGTPDKSHLGANAVLGTSLAVARAAARSLRLPLYRHLGGPEAVCLPVPMINILNGGQHAPGGPDFQEFMIVPTGAPSFAEALRYAAEIFAELRHLLGLRGQPTTVGDEGGFAPRLSDDEEACKLILDAISAAGYRPGFDVMLAIDAAANAFGSHGRYHRRRGSGKLLDSAGMVALYERWAERYPLIAIEDGLAEDDWEGFRLLTARLGGRLLVVGDDILVTNPRIIARAIDQRTCNAALIKPNQIGTLTETLESVRLCREAGWDFVISHRSGETGDAFIADLAVALGGGWIKAGSVCRGERLAKYNRLLEIEHELGAQARFGVKAAAEAR